MSVLAKQTEPGVGATDRQIAKIVPSSWQHTAHIDPTTIKPMAGRVIVRDIHNDEADGRYASLVLPANVDKAERRRLGVIVAVGQGDRWITLKERGPYGAFRHKGIKCDNCNGTGQVPKPECVCQYVGHIGICEVTKWEGDKKCWDCNGTGLARIPMETKPGDRVIFDRRREAEIEIGGERLSLVYEEQSILAVLET